MARNDAVALMAALSSSLTLATVFENTLRTLGKNYPADGIFSNIYLPDPSRIVFLASATRVRDALTGKTVVESRTMSETVPVTAALEPLRAVISPDIVIAETLRDDPFTAAIAPKLFPEMKSFIMLKLRLEDHPMGIVCFWSRRPRAFRPEHAKPPMHFRTLLALNVAFAFSRRLAEEFAELKSENQALLKTLASEKEQPLRRLLAASPSMAKLEPRIRQAGRFKVNVLITGESGTGKEVLANVIHEMSERSSGPFVRVNCAAIPEALMESEFFGHEEGAFTSATRRHVGFFEEANGGTLFLDEIGELPLLMQGKLLHALQNETIRRVGGTVDVPVDVRVIAATNRDLEHQVAEKAFRLDLFYRLNLLPIAIPPLRERPEDFMPLVRRFVAELCASYGITQEPRVTSRAIELAKTHPWPGNVRELKNAVARTLLKGELLIEELEIDGRPAFLPAAGTVGDSGGSLGGGLAEHGTSVATGGLVEGLSGGTPDPVPEDVDAAEDVDCDFETMQRRYFEALLRATHGRISGPDGAAVRAGMHPNTMRSRLAKLGIRGGGGKTVTAQR